MVAFAGVVDEVVQLAAWDVGIRVEAMSPFLSSSAQRSSATEKHRIWLNKFNDLTCRCVSADRRELLALLMARVASIAVDMPSGQVGFRAVFASMYT